MRALCKLKEIFRIIYHFESKLKKEYDLSINEALTLCALSGDNADKKTSGYMAEEIGISVSRMSRVFSSLENKGLISRRLGKEDKRKMIFTLTTKGRERLDKIHDSELNVPEFVIKTESE